MVINFNQRGLYLAYDTDDGSNVASMNTKYEAVVTFNFDDIMSNNKHQSFEEMIDKLIIGTKVKLVICSSIEHVDLKRVRENIDEFEEIYVYGYNNTDDVDHCYIIENDLDAEDKNSRLKLTGLPVDRGKIDEIKNAAYIKMVFKDYSTLSDTHNSVRSYVFCKAPYFAKLC